MKIRSFLVCALAAVTLASCSKNETQGTGGGDDEISTITIKLSEGVDNGSKAAAGSLVTDGDPIVFNEGYLFFVQNKIITKKVKIVTDGTGDNDASVNYADLTTTGVKFSIPKSSDRVYLAGNTPSTVTVPPVATDIEGFLEKTIDISTQMDAAGGVSNVSIYGAGAIIKVSGQSYDAEASFTIYPIVARTQIEKMSIGETQTTNPSPVDGDRILTDFKVKGIYVNYFLPDANLKGETDPSDLITYSQVSIWTPQTDPSATNHEKYYSLAYSGVLYDWNATSGLGHWATPAPTGDYKPNTGFAAWAYNIYTDQVPHIILRLTDIKYEEYDGTGSSWNAEASLGKDQYVTIGSFLNASGQDVTSFQKGYAYTIEDIPIKYAHLTDVPEEESNIDVNVLIEVMNWREQKIVPNLP